jgi:hypothetical protein
MAPACCHLRDILLPRYRGRKQIRVLLVDSELEERENQAAFREVGEGPAVA